MVASALSFPRSKSPRAVLLNIGNELLSGRTVNTNASFLGRQLSLLGFDVQEQCAVPDQSGAISQTLSRLEETDLVIVTGGLGPTPDDVTREAIAEHFSVPLVFSKKQFSAMASIYKKLGKKIPLLSRREAYYPANAKPLVNHFGIALGFWIQNRTQTLIVLPGVPTELQKMFIHDVKPLLRAKFKNLKKEKKLTVRFVGISEPAIMEKLGKDFFKKPFEFGIYPSEGEAQICLRSDSAALLAQLKKKIDRRLQPWVFSWGDESLVQVVSRLLLQKKKTLAVAESCTGGGLSQALTALGGASRFFLGGVTAYHSRTKVKMGVSPKTLKMHGEVSAETASELSLNISTLLNSDYGVGVTGIAGPTGGTPAKPVGLVYIAIAYQGDAWVTRHLFWGNREQIQRKAVIRTLEQLWRLLASK